MNSTLEERRRRLPFVAPIGLPLGLLFLVIALNRPTIANMRFHDLVFLLGTGVMLGAGLNEVRTLAFTGPADNVRYAGVTSEPRPVVVQNPLSA